MLEKCGLLVLSMKQLSKDINPINFASSVPKVVNAAMGVDEDMYGLKSSILTAMKQGRKASLSVLPQLMNLNQSIVKHCILVEKVARIEAV